MALQLEGWDKVPSQFEPTWLNIGFVVADWGGILSCLRSRSVASASAVGRDNAGSAVLLRATMIISLVLIAADCVAVWAMAGKPS